ncbi:Nitroreductase-like protein [Naematelia encephala]|uniref:Nitroreductase-like protein n=1 Tax=Naematelia encephala TaxID=71784 RepID=A0A1Y2BHU8_9TREE|nr:Nitroreductase-like protein [Naematelia encephala]
MSSSEAFFQAIETRRTNYALKAESTISDEALKALVERAVKHSPTSFNMQEARAVLVTGKAHKEIWELVKTEHVKTLGTDEGQIQFWTNKFDTQYAAGYGTVLFFEDDAVIEGYIAKMPAYKEAFIAFSGHVTGMLQIVVWTALAAEGLGGSLQHYTLNPAINTAIVEKLSLPATWKGTALLPFGVPAAPPAEKTFSPIEDRVKVFSG